MRFRLRLRSIEARAFENDVYFELGPRAVCRVFFRVNFNRLAVDRDGTRFVVRGNRVGKGIFALCGIVLQKVRQHLGAGEVVDSDDFVAFGSEHLSESKTADTAETVNRNSYVCHNEKSSDNILIVILRYILLSVVLYHTSRSSSNRFTPPRRKFPDFFSFFRRTIIIGNVREILLADVISILRISLFRRKQ